MCGRFGFISIKQSDGTDYWANLWDEDGTTRKDKIIEEYFSETRYDIRPTQSVPVIVKKNSQISVSNMKWGVKPVWSKAPIINARSEKMLDSNFWHKAFNFRRCLVPASFFYEWQDVGAKKNIPWQIKMKNQNSFAFAGIFFDYDDRDSEFSILTETANAEMARIHNHGGNKHRQPVILKETALKPWLDQTLLDDSAISLIQSYSEDEIDTVGLKEIGNDKTKQAPVPLGQKADDALF
ncbi:MAG: SOS response-associated peptidase [Leptospiraceae bacterium]|nr:SOS response-associated peptidase [Leptospiraceae bacterium]